MRRLVVPGTGGCTYQRADNRTRIGTIVDIARSEAHQLLCKHTTNQLEPTTTSGLVEGGKAVDMIPLDTQTGAYDLFAHSLKKYEFFNYDWRLDIRYSGFMLWTFLKAKKPEGPPWNVVCHSQGGLVLMWAAKLAQREGERLESYVGKVAFVGVPMFGAVNATAALLLGSEVFLGIHVAPAITRTWPSIYMMMPLWDVGLPSKGPEMFLPSTWNAAGLYPKNEPVDLSRHIDPELLQRARLWKDERSTGWFEPLRRLKGILFAFGENRRTRAALPHFPDLPDDSRADDKVIVRGDSLVPLDLTWSMLPSWVQREATSLIVPCDSHMMLCNERGVFDKCETFFA